MGKLGGRRGFKYVLYSNDRFQLPNFFDIFSFYIIFECTKKNKFEGIRKWRPLEIQCLISCQPELDNELILRGRKPLGEWAKKVGWVIN